MPHIIVKLTPEDRRNKTALADQIVKDVLRLQSAGKIVRVIRGDRPASGRDSYNPTFW